MYVKNPLFDQIVKQFNVGSRLSSNGLLACLGCKFKKIFNVLHYSSSLLGQQMFVTSNFELYSH